MKINIGSSTANNILHERYEPQTHLSKAQKRIELTSAKLLESNKILQDKLKEAETKLKEVEESKQNSDAKLLVVQEEFKIVHKEMEASQARLQPLQEKIKRLELHIEHSWNISCKQICSEKEIGRGGYGTVSIGQLKVAVKQLHHLIMSPEMIELMHREINIMSKLCHPNLLQFVAAAFDHPSGNPLIITELMDMSLRDAYKKKLLTNRVREKLAIMKDAAAGLDYLHCLPDPIIHRDISSANVLLASKGTGKWVAKISDFGSAKLAKYAVTQAPGALIYGAPEALQAVAAQEPSEQTVKMDVYSFGVMLCEVMTEQLPLTQEVFHSMLQEVEKTLPSVYDLIGQCTEKDYKQRPSMSMVIGVLEKLY